MGNLRRKPEDSNVLTERYFEKILVETRYLDAVIPDTSVELFGKTFATPVMTAALSHIPGKDGDGMVQMAQGAAEAGALTWVGMTTLEQYGEIAQTGAPLVRIIKPYKDEREIFSRIEQAEEEGAVAVGMDIDHSFNKRGQPDSVLGMPMSPKTTKDIASYCKRTKLPFLLKGVLSAQDAQKCLDAGVGGILVSHHHGIMASAVPALLVLPEIVKTVQGKIPIFVDGSFENGMDVFKALALGADAVCVGRALMSPIQQQGAEGCRQTIQDITDELAAAMARTGSRDIKHIDPSLLWIDGKHLH